MNDPVLYAKKFEELIALAREATTGFEKTAVFAAAQALADAFSANEDEFDGYALEKVEQAIHHRPVANGARHAKGRAHFTIVLRHFAGLAD